MLLATVRTITLNPTTGAAAQGGVSYSGWVLGSVVPMWLMLRMAVASSRLMWHLGRRRRTAEAVAAPSPA